MEEADRDYKIERQKRKIQVYAEMYGAGDVKIAQKTGQYPNPSFLDLAELELRCLSTLPS